MTIRQSISKGRLGSTKSNKIRYVPMRDEVCEMLLLRAVPKGFVFLKPNGKFLESVICLDWLDKAASGAGLRKIGWHLLRHTFCSHLAQLGVSPVIMKELLGHSDVRTTMRYSHVTTAATREAISLLTNKCHKNATLPKIDDQHLFLTTLKKSEIVKKD